MKKLLYLLLVLLALGMVAVMTCPDRDAHTDALKELVRDAIAYEMNAEEDGFSQFATAIGTGLFGMYFESSLSVRNYFVCSVGSLDIEGENTVVSVGMFNHVFTKSKKSMRDYMDSLE